MSWESFEGCLDAVGNKCPSNATTSTPKLMFKDLLAARAVAAKSKVERAIFISDGKVDFLSVWFVY